ncbi:MAG: hypothetical protein DMF64_09730 [Acidobacteria bacterium]|nr:MAG: hypothetical protein DMF64_09730 [Acidobacteriota bacterium]
MLFMVIERFKDGDAAPVYRRFRERGRMLPEGLRYVDSWIDANFARCFQLMECADPRLFDEWIACWQDLVEFEIIPVTSSKEAAAQIAAIL